MSTVVKRTTEADGTRQVIYKANTPDYDPLDWVQKADLSAVTEVDPWYWFIEGDDSIRDMTQEEKDTADLGRLAILMGQRVVEVRAKTEECFANAHASFNGVNFTITHIAQANWMAMVTSAQFDMLPYPVEVTSATGAPYAFQTKTEFLAFGQTILGTVKAIVDVERSLVNAILAVTSKPELDAIVDPR